ncbi:acyl-CoA dehydrogenase family protein [Antrihabitans stalactiti]|uniref:Acyl-CoA dehydrogenase n=1 Tax=Antrihabitans stalactiti TaxID=2584121 RepID=A0A848KLP2_9NOCA|nr:acyl-CoA dehydrogenase family protein [Antrihabitans stalactiti]NMN96697.1 acyl-CoA dehydrogenase [Antrihabitans stalactiti]
MTATAENDADLLRREVRDVTSRWQTEGRYTPRCDNWLRGFDLKFSKELANRWLIGVSWPTEFGGRGLTATARLVVAEELLRAGAPVAAHWVGDRQIGPAILRHGTAELKHEILPGIVRADNIFCLGMSEPNAGSDLAAVATTATRVDGGWRIRGRKTWTSGAHQATHMYLLARTDRSTNRHDGLSEFVLDMNADGVEVTAIVDLTGEHHFNEVLLDDVFVPDHRVLGTVGNGWKQVVEQLSFERGGPERFLSSYPLLAQLIDEDRIGAATYGVVGELIARLTVLRRMAYDVARSIDAGHAPIQQSATLKYLGNIFEIDVIEAARTVLGPAMNNPTSTFGHAVLSAPGFSIRGGAAEVLLGLIARQERQ